MNYLVPTDNMWEYPAYQRRYYESKNGRRNAMIWNSKRRAEKMGFEFDLKADDIIVPDNCPIFETPLDFTMGGYKKYAPSLDRIDNTKGYTKDNIQIISRIANSMKSDATRDELLKFARWIIKTYELPHTSG